MKFGNDNLNSGTELDYDVSDLGIKFGNYNRNSNIKSSNGRWNSVIELDNDVLESGIKFGHGT